jgi:hypothetical protein
MKKKSIRSTGKGTIVCLLLRKPNTEQAFSLLAKAVGQRLTEMTMLTEEMIRVKVPFSRSNRAVELAEFCWREPMIARWIPRYRPLLRQWFEY